jgi:EmrB/QacA subfamily drug resistance transporter
VTAAGARAASLVLPILAVTQFLMTVDASVMNVSISALVEDLDTSVTAIQGVITAYTLVMAAGMITGGKIGDIVGRRRAMRIGLVIYALGSGLTAVAPNVIVLTIGWSLLEGIGAALIMPTVTALIAGNFTGRARAAAYGTIAAAAAVAIAAGPIVGGFVTAYASWRWVFAAEVVIAAGIFIGTRAITDVAPEERPVFDGIGAVLSALGLGLVVFAVLQSGTWGWVQPKVPEGSDATPSWLGLSPVVWLLAGGLLVLWLFIEWERHRQEAGRAPLVDPALFANRRLTTGLWLLLLQYLVMMGVFFTMPLFLSIVLGLDAFDTGLRMLPLSLALVVTAPAIPKLLPNASPRRVVQAGLLITLAATLLLAWRFEDGAGASITVLPFLLMGVGMGALASQLGNVIVSSEPVERSGEVGGLQYTAQNLGSSLGTALVGAVVIGALGSLVLQNVQDSAVLDASLKQQAQVELSSGVPFVSDAQLESALAKTDIPPAQQQEIVAINADARLGALRRGMVVVSLFVLLALLLSPRLPAEPQTGEATAPAPAEAAPARGP